MCVLSECRILTHHTCDGGGGGDSHGRTTSSLYVSFSVGAVAVTLLSVIVSAQVSARDSGSLTHTDQLALRHRRAPNDTVLINNTVLDTQNNTVLNGSIRNNTVLNGSMHNDTVLDTRNNTVPNGSIHNDTVLNGIMHNDTVLDTRNNTVLNGSIRNDTVLNGSMHNDTVLDTRNNTVLLNNTLLSVSNYTVLDIWNDTVPDTQNDTVQFSNITHFTASLTTATTSRPHKPHYADAAHLKQDSNVADGSKYRSKIRQNLRKIPAEHAHHGNVHSLPSVPTIGNTSTTLTALAVANSTMTTATNDTLTLSHDVTVSASNTSSSKTLQEIMKEIESLMTSCLLYTSPSPRDS